MEEHNEPSAQELELLGILQEEAAEVIQIISKIRRFGLLSYNPYDPNKKTNQQLLIQEISDLLCIVKLITEVGEPPLLTCEDLALGALKKREKLKRYLTTFCLD